MKKALQQFSKEYLAQCRMMTSIQILQFLEDYRRLIYEVAEKCHPISLKIEPSLLSAFKRKSAQENIPYQTQIKKLMRDWLKNQ